MVFSKIKDDALFNIKFVRSVESHPCLYNNTLAEYSRKDVSDLAWRTVAEEINESVPYCKEKWKNLRSVFVRTLKPLPGGLQRNRKPYYLNDAMQFLLPYIKSSPAIMDVSETVASPYSCDDADDPLALADSNQDDIELIDIDNDSTPSNLDARLWKKRKTYETSEFERYEQKNCSSPRKMFLLSLVPELDELTEEQMRLFRRKVFQLIDNLKSHSSNMVESNSVFLSTNSYSVGGEYGNTEPSVSNQDQQNESGFQTDDRKPFRNTR